MIDDGVVYTARLEPDRPTRWWRIAALTVCAAAVLLLAFTGGCSPDYETPTMRSTATTVDPQANLFVSAEVTNGVLTIVGRFQSMSFPVDKFIANCWGRDVDVSVAEDAGHSPELRLVFPNSNCAKSLRRVRGGDSES